MKKLEKVKFLIRRLKYNLNLLTDYGFKRCYTHSASGHIWKNTKLGIIVKIPCIIGLRRPKLAIPTLSVPVPKLWWEYGRDKILIQPIAKRVALDKAFCRLVDLGCDNGDIDFKRANIGWYRGKPVLIDW